MAVEIRYVVVRAGRETMTFTDKKTADAYDKKLEAIDRLCELMAEASVQVDEETLDVLATHLADHAADVMQCLKGLRPAGKRPAGKRPAGKRPASERSSTTSPDQPEPIERAG